MGVRWGLLGGWSAFPESFHGFLGTCKSPLEKSLLQSFAQFNWLDSLLLSCGSSSHVLDSEPEQICRHGLRWQTVLLASSEARLHF